MISQMENALQIEKEIDKLPYYHRDDRGFLETWFNLNDSVTPIFITREEWNNRLNNKLDTIEDVGETKKKMFIPEDVRLWEISKFMIALDLDTFYFRNTTAYENGEKVNQFGELLSNCGIYIAKRLNVIEEGRDIAEYIAHNFYEYGNLIQRGNKDNSTSNSMEDIASQQLSPDNTEACDAFLAGGNLHAKRLLRASKRAGITGNHDAEIELQRQETLSQFFRVLSRSTNQFEDLRLSGKSDNIKFNFVNNTRSRIKEVVDTPLDSFLWSIHRRGIVKLSREMKSHKSTWHKYALKLASLLGFEVAENNTIYEKLKLDEMKILLKESRRTNDKKEVSRLEIDLAKRINVEVAKFNQSYHEQAYVPSVILKEGSAQCLGFNTIASSLLTEQGIEHFVFGAAEHTKIIFKTSDDQFYWMEPQVNNGIEIVDDSHLCNLDGSPNPLWRISLLELLKHPHINKIDFSIPSQLYKKWQISDFDPEETPLLYGIIAIPQAGLQYFLLDNLAKDLRKNVLSSKGNTSQDKLSSITQRALQYFYKFDEKVSPYLTKKVVFST